MSEQSSNAGLAVRAVTCLGNRDFAALRAMLDDAVELEFPFHPKGARTYRGIDAMLRQFSAIDVFETMSIEIVRVFNTGEETVIVEGRSKGHYNTSRPDYTNHYLFVLSFADGKLQRWREFYNPLELMKQSDPPPQAAPASKTPDIREAGHR